MAIENVELVHECFPQLRRMEIARMKEDNRRWQAEKSETGKTWSGQEINKSQSPSYSLGLHPPEAVDEFNN